MAPHWLGSAWLGRHGSVRQGGRSKALQLSGRAWLGWRGVARQRHGTARLGTARRCKAQPGCQGMSGLGWAALIWARRGWRGIARLGKTGRCPAAAQLSLAG